MFFKARISEISAIAPLCHATLLRFTNLTVYIYVLRYLPALELELCWTYYYNNCQKRKNCNHLLVYIIILFSGLLKYFFNSFTMPILRITFNNRFFYSTLKNLRICSVCLLYINSCLFSSIDKGIFDPSLQVFFNLVT